MIVLTAHQIRDQPMFKPKYYDLIQENARSIRKVVFLSKQTSATSQDEGFTSRIKENPIVQCTQCGALMWTSKSTRTYTRIGERRFSICCNQGKNKASPTETTPNICGIRLLPFTFRIQGQSHHRTGSLILSQERLPIYLQLYIFDTNNEVSNRLKAMGKTSTEEFNIRLVSDKGKGKEYDLPSTSEVTSLIVGDMSSNIGERDIVVQFQSETLQQIRDDHPLYMSFQYPLMFPYIGRLLHQYVVDVYTKIEEDRLRWARNNQDVLRVELYGNVLDAISKGDTDVKLIGQRFILPPSFTAICIQFGNPDLFITMTVNPNWQEIKEHLTTYGGDSPNDIPDIECQFFKIKLDQLLEHFKKETFFKPYTTTLHRIEFQKRGLPHAYIVLWFGNSSRTPSTEEVDRIISVELPNKEEDPKGYNLVSKHMIHGPCGVIKPKSPCIEKNVCTKKYLRPYNDYTSIDKSGYVLYRRRRDEIAYVVKDGVVMNNISVILHNIDILQKYEAHINVEWCSRTSALMYLFKYITKGVDKATAVLEKGNIASTSDKANETVNKQLNEIQDFIDCCYLSACESMWQIFPYHIHKRKPSVQKLIIHLDGENNITFKETDDLGRVIRKPGIKKTMFTECMMLCRRSEFARTLTYVQIPEYFIWNNDNKI
ncbi:hypothetical protein N665_2976s0001 [Sinapis alba]|nr:hypothetical protein N665_2976s0001 [Sinapis alba]